jgi:hypothetical protein
MVHCSLGRIQDHSNNHLYCRQPTAAGASAVIARDMGQGRRGRYYERLPNRLLRLTRF